MLTWQFLNDVAGIATLGSANKKLDLAHWTQYLLPAEEISRLMKVPILKGDLCMLRDKAAAARLFLTGERIFALTTSPILALDMADGCIRQWPELGVHTKFGKKAMGM
jgi:hypothetical protein